MTNLETLLKNGKLIDRPALRAVYYAQTGTPGWRMVFTQNNKSVVKPNGNSLLTKSLVLNDYITTTAIMTTNEKFLKSVGIATDKNTFYMESNASGIAINANIPGEFAIDDKIIYADQLFEVEQGETFIVNVESPFANPFLKQHLPVINPSKNAPVLVMGTDGQLHPYFRHNELRLKSETPFGHQSIAQFYEKLTNEDFPLYATPAVILSLTKYDQEKGTDFVSKMTANPYLQFNLNAQVMNVELNKKMQAEVSELLM